MTNETYQPTYQRNPTIDILEGLPVPYNVGTVVVTAGTHPANISDCHKFKAVAPIKLPTKISDCSVYKISTIETIQSTSDEEMKKLCPCFMGE